MHGYFNTMKREQHKKIMHGGILSYTKKIKSNNSIYVTKNIIVPDKSTLLDFVSLYLVSSSCIFLGL